MSLTALTVMAAPTVPPPSPASKAESDACTSKPKVSPAPLLRFADGVNFNPAPPWATLMKSPLTMGVVPSLWNRVPPVMLVILKKVTSAPSAPFGLITSPAADWVSSSVTVAVTVGVSATGLTVRAMVSVSCIAPPRPVLPRSSLRTSRVSEPNQSASGV